MLRVVTPWDITHTTANRMHFSASRRLPLFERGECLGRIMRTVGARDSTPMPLCGCGQITLAFREVRGDSGRPGKRASARPRSGDRSFDFRAQITAIAERSACLHAAGGGCQGVELRGSVRAVGQGATRVTKGDPQLRAHQARARVRGYGHQQRVEFPHGFDEAMGMLQRIRSSPHPLALRCG